MPSQNSGDPSEPRHSRNQGRVVRTGKTCMNNIRVLRCEFERKRWNNRGSIYHSNRFEPVDSNSIDELLARFEGRVRTDYGYLASLPLHLLGQIVYVCLRSASPRREKLLTRTILMNGLP